MSYTVYDPKTGQILRSGYVATHDINKQCREGEAIIPEQSSDKTHYIDTCINRPVPLPLKPSKHHTFEWNTKIWVLPPDAIYRARVVQKAVINAARVAELQNIIVEYEGKTYKAAQIDLTAALSKVALYPDGYQIKWRTVDNEVVLLSVGNLRELALKMDAAIQEVHEHSWERKTQIENAQEIEAIEGISLIIKGPIDPLAM